MNHQAERDRRAKAYSYRAYRRRVQQALAQRVQLAVVAGAALVLAILVAASL